MRRPFSAYAALELEPGADRSAVETAYRRLIKLHHPDRSGGDSSRAAEINRAYRELRGTAASQPPLPVRRSGTTRARRKPRRGIPGWWLIIAGLVVIAVVQRDELLDQGMRWASRMSEAGAHVASSPARSNVAANSLLDGPLNVSVVSRSVEQAIRMTQSGEEQALSQHSRDCHRDLRRAPKLASLDRCSAFDSAVAALLDLDPNKDTGSFNASSVTARQMTAASLLSGDYLAIERRLNRIRGQVELALMPSAPVPAPEPPTISGEPENMLLEIEP